MNKIRKDNKIINNFLSNLSDAHGYLMIDDLEKLLKTEQTKVNAKMRMLQDFVVTVKQECVMNQ